MVLTDISEEKQGKITHFYLKLFGHFGLMSQPGRMCGRLRGFLVGSDNNNNKKTQNKTKKQAAVRAG